MDSTLKFIVLFSENDVKLVEDQVQMFFEETLEDVIPTYSIEYGKPKNVALENVVLFHSCELEINIPISNPLINELYSKIVQDWCDPRKNPLSHLWLYLKNVSLLDNSGKLFHHDVRVKEIAFGSFPIPRHFMEHYSYKNEQDTQEIMATFIHGQRKFEIFTCLVHKDTCKQKPIHNKFQVFYNSISKVVVNYLPKNDVVQIYLLLQHFPFLFYGKNRDKDKENKCDEIKLEFDQEYQEKNWDRALFYGCRCNQSYFYLRTIGRCPVFKIVVPKKHKTHEIVERLIQRCPSSTIFYFASMKTIVPELEFMLENFQFPFSEEMFMEYQGPIRDDMMFNLRYSWETIMCQSYEIMDQLRFFCQHNSSFKDWDKLSRKLTSFFRRNNDALVRCFYEISDLLSKRLFFDFRKTLENYFNLFNRSQTEEDPLPDGMCKVRRIILTPSRIIYIPPSEHFDNRVIRKFGDEFFLRVFIQDDDFSKLTFAIQRTWRKEEFMDRVFKKTLNGGFRVSTRRYELLASSSSQLREHGIYMYAKDHQGITSEYIRRWMGDFSQILNVAKYMARMGQCFSTSEEAVQIEIEDADVIHIQDVQTRDGQYTFSDGVGMISKQLAKEIRKKAADRNDLVTLCAGRKDLIALRKKLLYDPSAFQIRFKGCKGMVAESPTLTGHKIAVRKSMNKFQCNNSSALEIVKISAPRAVFLNRSLICILENLGISESVFLDLQKKMVFDLTDALIYEKKAYKMLENSTGLDIPFKKLHNSGVSLAQEPFFRSLLLCVYKLSIEKLKSKARIAIPHEFGRNMLGIMDETGTLEYGQIFAQYSVEVSNIKSEVKPLLGTVVVTKHPCMHPGDVRKFEAVWNEKLKHLKDVIVFPAKGPRPHPDEMAGSDLDGDEYAVFWEPRLIFERDNYKAMSYPPNEEVRLDKPIEVSDMVEFLCRYIKDDQIGQMANAHLAIADQAPEGVFSEICMRIAEKYPKALDFAKSGTTCTLDSSERARCYPDFMEKGSRNNSYKSTKALGLLYRVIRNLEASVSNIDNEAVIEPDLEFEYPEWRQFAEIAEKRRQEYCLMVRNIFKKYGMENEAEVLSGCPQKLSKFYNNKYDSENIVLLSKKYMINVIKRFKIKFINDCYNRSNPNNGGLVDDKTCLKMASAMYMVTYQDPDSKILSFPWIESEWLLKIRDWKRGGSVDTPKSVFIQMCDRTLQKEFPQASRSFADLREPCHCVSVLRKVLGLWMTHMSFILSSSAAENTFCSHCLDRIVETYLKGSKSCCSASKSHCNCHQLCSPMAFVMGCLKHYASDVVNDLGVCGSRLDNGVSCAGFNDGNLHSLALKTYAAVAITRNFSYLGLDRGSHHDYDCNDEGDPIRVPVSQQFEEILTGQVDRVSRILESLSGVKKIHIDGSSERNGYYILVHAIGRAFHRYNLEELIMDPKCSELIRSHLN